MDEPVELETIPGEIRVFQGPLLLPKGDIAAPEYSFWFRSQGAPDDAAIQQALLIPPTLMFLIGVALRPQRLSQDQAHISVDTGVLAHTVTFHDEARVNDWLLVTMESPQSGAGCTFGRGHVFSRGGTLLASFEQENMVRAMRAHSRLLPS
jgi:acyl-CoA thioesterase II